jgi:hypothetical protein
MSAGCGVCNRGPVSLVLIDEGRRLSADVRTQFLTHLISELELVLPGVPVLVAADARATCGCAEPSLRPVGEHSDGVPCTTDGDLLWPVPFAEGSSDGAPLLRFEVTVRDYRPYFPMRLALQLRVVSQPGEAELAVVSAVWESGEADPPSGLRARWRHWRSRRRRSTTRELFLRLPAVSPDLFLKGASPQIAGWFAEASSPCTLCPDGCLSGLPDDAGPVVMGTMDPLVPMDLAAPTDPTLPMLPNLPASPLETDPGPMITAPDWSVPPGSHP